MVQRLRGRLNFSIKCWCEKWREPSCRALALQIKTSREVDGNLVSSEWIQYKWRCYNITKDSWRPWWLLLQLLDQLDVGSWVLRWWRETDFLLSSLCWSKYILASNVRDHLAHMPHCISPQHSSSWVLRNNISGIFWIPWHLSWRISILPHMLIPLAIF